MTNLNQDNPRAMENAINYTKYVVRKKTGACTSRELLQTVSYLERYGGLQNDPVSLFQYSG